MVKMANCMVDDDLDEGDCMTVMTRTWTRDVVARMRVVIRRGGRSSYDG